MNKKLKITLIVFGFVLIACLIFKIIFLKLHYVEIVDDDVIKGLSLDKTITVYNNKIEETEYIIEDNIKIRNDFKNFQKKEKEGEYDSTKYLFYDESNRLTAAFWVGQMEQYIEFFSTDFLTIYNGNNNGKFKDEDRKKFLLENEIENDVDFLKYIKEHYYCKSNIFTSFKNIKRNYAINMFVSVVLPSIDSTTIIDGDYLGYIFNIKDNMREVHILKDKKSYIFMFMGDEYTTDEYLKEIISTIEFE